MKRIISISTFIVMLVVLAASCQQNSEPETLEEKKKQLDEYQKELVDLKQKMRKIEEDIQEIETKKGIRESKIKVKLSDLQPKLYNHKIEVQGLVESDENVTVSSEVSGVTQRIMIDIGDYVNKGDLILKVDDEMLRNQYEELRTAYDLAERTYQKQKNLWDKGIGSEIQYLEAKNRKESLEKQMTTLQSRIEKYNVKAPISGKVDDVMVNQGELVSPGVPIANIVDVSQVKIVADVSERYVGKIKEGDSVTVIIPAIGMERETVVQATGQVINRENRTFKVMVKLDNSNGAMKPNLLAKIRIYDFVQNDALIIPTRLVHFQNDSSYVFIADVSPDDTLAKKVGVDLSFSNAQESLVSKGLVKGDLLIVEGHDKVSNGDKINPVR